MLWLQSTLLASLRFVHRGKLLLSKQFPEGYSILDHGQSASEKRRLLEFDLSNSFWAGGELTPVFRQPFDMIKDMAMIGAKKMAAGLLTSRHHQEEPPR
jgi:hypothetical protein